MRRRSGYEKLGVFDIWMVDDGGSRIVRKQQTISMYFYTQETQKILNIWSSHAADKYLIFRAEQIILQKQCQ